MRVQALTPACACPGGGATALVIMARLTYRVGETGPVAPRFFFLSMGCRGMGCAQSMDQNGISSSRSEAGAGPRPPPELPP